MAKRYLTFEEVQRHYRNRPATTATTEGGDPTSPADVPVKDLADHLATIDDAEEIQRMKKADTRSTAAAHYDARLNELA